MCDLTGDFDLSGPTISHHLKVLREAGLITGERRGTWIYYRVGPRHPGHPLAGALPRRPRTGSDRMSTAPDLDAPVAARLSTLDRFLPVWILAAMAVGLGARAG